jgi:hypothetical protein
MAGGRKRRFLDDINGDVGLEGFREECLKFSILEHGGEDAIEIAIGVGGVGYRQLVTDAILFL